MTDSERTHLSWLFEYAPQGASAVAIAVGTVVLFGWTFDLAPLTSAFSGFAAMKANTALGFILAGISLWTSALQTTGHLFRAISRFCGWGVLLLGLLVLAEYLGNADFGIDQMLVREVTNLPGDIPGRMAVSTAACFATLGAALVLLSREKGGFIFAVHVLAIVPIVVAGVALVSYGYAIEAFLREKLNYTPMAIHTAAVFVLLGLGIVSAQPIYPFRRIMTSDSVSGSTARRLLPAAIGLQLVMGWLLLRGLQAGYLSEAVGLALFAVVNMAGLGTLIQWNAAILYRVDVQRRLAEKALQESERYTRQLLAELPTAVVVHGPDSTIRYGNASALSVLGLSEDQLLGKTAFDPYWHFIRDDGSVMPVEEFPVNRVISGSRPLRDYLVGIVRSAEAEPLWVYVNAFPNFDSGGDLQEVIVSFVDITGRKKLERELEQQARKDMLTGLDNRRYFFELAELELARSRRYGEQLSLLMMDLDNFKSVNDTYGHHVGDAVLQKLGEICLHTFREIDFVGRLGGEEFAALLPETSGEQALEVAERLRLAVEGAAAKLENGSFFHFTISIGVASLDATDARIDVVLKRADAALYKAKNSGRNRVCGEGIV